MVGVSHVVQHHFYGYVKAVHVHLLVHNLPGGIAHRVAGGEIVFLNSVFYQVFRKSHAMGRRNWLQGASYVFLPAALQTCQRQQGCNGQICWRSRANSRSSLKANAIRPYNSYLHIYHLHIINLHICTSTIYTFTICTFNHLSIFAIP